MTADAAHVAAVAEAMLRTGSIDVDLGTIEFAADVAVETLTPLIRAQVAAETVEMAERFAEDSRDELKTRDHRFGLAAQATVLHQWAASIAEGTP